MSDKKEKFTCKKCNESFEKESSLKLHEQHCEAKGELSEIEVLKEELLAELSPVQKQKKKLAFGSLAVTGVLVILMLVSIAQTVQSASILKKIKNNDIAPAGATSSALPSSLNDLPDMVGGC